MTEKLKFTGRLEALAYATKNPMVRIFFNTSENATSHTQYLYFSYEGYQCGFCSSFYDDDATNFRTYEKDESEPPKERIAFGEINKYLESETIGLVESSACAWTGQEADSLKKISRLIVAECLEQVAEDWDGVQGIDCFEERLKERAKKIREGVK